MKEDKLPVPGELWVNTATYEYLYIDAVNARETTRVVFFYYLSDTHERQSRFLSYFLDHFRKYE